MAADCAALLGEGAIKATDNVERATKLRRYDNVCAQAVNPSGAAPIVGASMGQVWDSIKIGNKKVQFFSEFCSMDKHRRGIAISRMAECLLACFETIEKPDTAKLLQEAPLKKAMAELKELKPHLQVLYGGKTQSASTSLASIGAHVSMNKVEGEVNQAATAVYEWLCKDQSALRGLIGLMSSGGCYWTAYCSELSGRAAVHKSGGAIPKAEFVGAAVERLCKQGGADVGGEAPSLSSALFG